MHRCILPFFIIPRTIRINPHLLRTLSTHYHVNPTSHTVILLHISKFCTSTNSTSGNKDSTHNQQSHSNSHQHHQNSSSRNNMMLRQLTHHYTRLGVAPTVTRAQLSAAYRAAALKHHPDRGGKASTFAAIRESYEVLLTHLNRTHAYQPASLRSFRSSPQDQSGFWGIFFSVLAPTAVGLVLGVRLMYHGSDRKGLRAGGTSRFRIPDSHDFASYHEVVTEEKGLQIITSEQKCIQHQHE